MTRSGSIGLFAFGPKSSRFINYCSDIKMMSVLWRKERSKMKKEYDCPVIVVDFFSDQDVLRTSLKNPENDPYWTENY